MFASSPDLPAVGDEGDVEELLAVADVAQRPRHVRLEVVPPQAVLLAAAPTAGPAAAPGPGIS